MLGKLVIYIATTAGLYRVLPPRSTPKYYVGMLIYTSAMLMVSFYGLAAAVVMSIAGRKYDVNWLVARTFYHLASRWMGITVKVEGWEYLETNPGMYVGNHQSFVDIMFLAKMFPKRCTMTAKESLKFTPLLGQWMLMSGAVFINRGNSKQAHQSLEKAAKDMRDRSISLWIFPEGTRTLFQTANLLPFKKGAFHLAVQAGVPVIPVVCENYWNLYHKGLFEDGEIKVKVLPPIPTKGLTADDVTKLSTDTREVMLKALKELSPQVSKEVEAADNAKLAAIAKQNPSSGQLGAATPGPADATPPPASVADRVSVATPNPATPGQDLSSSSLSDIGASSDARERKPSLSQSSSVTDDEMVIVDRPPPA